MKFSFEESPFHNQNVMKNKFSLRSNHFNQDKEHILKVLFTQVQIFFYIDIYKLPKVELLKYGSILIPLIMIE